MFHIVKIQQIIPFFVLFSECDLISKIVQWSQKTASVKPEFTIILQTIFLDYPPFCFILVVCTYTHEEERCIAIYRK